MRARVGSASASNVSTIICRCASGSASLRAASTASASIARRTSSCVMRMHLSYMSTCSHSTIGIETGQEHPTGPLNSASSHWWVWLRHCKFARLLGGMRASSMGDWVSLAEPCHVVRPMKEAHVFPESEQIYRDRLLSPQNSPFPTLVSIDFFSFLCYTLSMVGTDF